MFIVQESRENDQYSIYISGQDQLIVSENGSVKEIQIPEPPLSDNLTPGQIQVIKKENRNINSMEISQDRQYMALATENKQLVVFDRNFQVIKNLVISRAASKVVFTPQNDILVADKTGDVYLYKITMDEPILLLGHLSVILDMVVSPCGQYIVTCDRDEKIRVSHFPNTYNIASFCMGHTEFVSSVKFIGDVMVSASGDGSVRVWQYLEGKMVGKLDTANLVDEATLDKLPKDVTVVPVTSLQVHHCSPIIAFTLHQVNKVFLYKLNSNQLSALHTIEVFPSFSYSFANKLYVLSGKLSVYNISDSEAVLLDVSDRMGQFNVCTDQDISLLYKRKYDNVQEYMERKKLRLEVK